MARSNKILLLSLCLSSAVFAQIRGASTASYDFSGTSHTTYSLPALNVPSGNSLVGCLRASGTSWTATVADTGSTNTFSVLGYENINTNTRLMMFKTDNTTAVSGDVIAVTLSQSTQAYFAGAAVLYSGVATSAYDSGSLASGTSGTSSVASVSSGTFSTAQPPEIVVGCASSNGDIGLSPGSVFASGGAVITAMSDAVDTGGQVLMIEDGSLYYTETGITSSINTAAGTDFLGLISAAFKNSHTVSPPFLTQTFSGAATVTIQGQPYAYSGATVTLTYNLLNPSSISSLTSVQFSNTLPSGLVVATPNGLTGSCGGGTISATAGSSTVSLTGATMTANATCSFSVNLLTSGGAATVTNTPGSASSTQSGVGPIPPSASIVLLGTATSTVSNISVSAVDHASVNVFWQLSPDASYCQMYYGTTSGVYQYSSGTQPANYNTTNDCSMSLGGLAPSTTYYLMPTGRQGQVSTSGMCMTGGSCGTSEQTFTTLSLPAVHPAPPAAPATWTPTFPSLTGYTTITMMADPSTQLCEANTVSGPETNWSGSVTNGMYLQTVLNNIWFDTLIEFPEGLSCLISQSGSELTGINLPTYSPNRSSNDWVIFRTHANSVTDFPPAGVRTGPQFASKLATLVAQTPNNSTSAMLYGGENLRGNLFDAQASNANGFWWQNIAFSHTTSTCVSGGNPCYPTGVTDPPVFGVPINTQPTYPYNTEDTCPSSTTTPCNMVLDRVLIEGQPYPSRELGCFEPGGIYWAIIDSYCASNFWTLGVWQGDLEPNISGATLYVPNDYFQLNAYDNTPRGMQTTTAHAGTYAGSLNVATGSQTFTINTGLSYTSGNLIELQNQVTDYIWMLGTVSAYNSGSGSITVSFTSTNGPSGSYSGWNVVTPDIITFSGVSTYAGYVVAWLAPTGLVVEYQTAAGVSASCTYCTTMAVSSPANADVPANSVLYFTGSFNGSGTFQIVTSPSSPTIYTTVRPVGVYWTPGQYGLFDNNYLVAIGQTIYNDTNGPAEDYTWTHNYLYFPRSKMYLSGQWDGYGYAFRNIVETKQQLRGLFQGNIFDGAAAYQNAGNIFYIAGSYLGTWSTGTQDINVTGNIFKHISAGIQIAGGGTSPTDPPTANRLAFTNNIFADLDRSLYQGAYMVDIYASGALSSEPLGGDVNFSNNTIGLTRGSGPTFLTMGGSTQSSIMGEGWKITNNIDLVSLGFTDVFWTLVGGQQPPFTSAPFTTNPVIPSSIPAPAANGTWLNYMNTTFIHAGSSITPNYQLGNNVIVGGQCDLSASRPCVSQWSDLTPSQIGTYISGLWPSTDTTSVFPCGSSDPFNLCGASTSLSSRMTAIGWSALGANTSLLLGQGSGVPTLYPQNVPSVYQPGNLGANPTLIMQQTGTVTNIAVNPASTAIGFAYTAPDSRACSIDISTDDSTWTRQADSGGGLNRSITFTSLSASTLYYYRLMCYADQAATYEYLANQITSGTVKTNATGSRSVSVTPIISGSATKALLTFTPQTGSATTNICSATCSTSLSAPGTYTLTIQPETSGSANTGLPTVSTVVVP